MKVEPFLKARKPAFKLWVDFGEPFGLRQTSAQITVHYDPETLVGRQVVGCLNLGEKNIGGHTTLHHNAVILRDSLDERTKKVEKDSGRGGRRNERRIHAFFSRWVFTRTDLEFVLVV